MQAVVHDFKSGRGRGSAKSSSGGVWQKGSSMLALQVRSKKHTPGWVPTRHMSRFFGAPVLDVDPESAYIVTDSMFNNTSSQRRAFLDRIHEGQRVAVQIAFRQVRMQHSMSLQTIVRAMDSRWLPFTAAPVHTLPGDCL